MMCAGDLPLLADLVYAYAFPPPGTSSTCTLTPVTPPQPLFMHIFYLHCEIIPFFSSFTVNASYSLVGLARHTAEIMTPCTRLSLHSLSLLPVC